MPHHAGERPMISIITPCYNEELNVETCAAEVARVMAEQLVDYDYEHIFCDNASTDTTMTILRRLAAGDEHIRVVGNARNVGPLRNIANGLRFVSGDYVVPMVPADIQDPPSVIPEMIAKMTPEVDVVYGVRKNRREGLLLRWARGLYYAAIKVGAGVAPPSHAGEFLLARSHIIDAVVASGSHQSYVRGLIAQTAPRFDTVEYSWGVRENGQSRNSVPELIDQAIGGLITTARRPLRWALFVGMLLALVGIAVGIGNFILFLTGGPVVNQGIPTLIIGMFVLGGLQLFLIGIIGEYVVSMHAATNPEPPVVVRESINLVPVKGDQ